MALLTWLPCSKATIIFKSKSCPLGGQEQRVLCPDSPGKVVDEERRKKRHSKTKNPGSRTGKRES